MNAKTVLVMAAALLASGCSSIELKSLGKAEPLRNAQGHVVGHKEMLCDCSRGEDVARIQLYVPRVNDAGMIVGYEEPVKGQVSILRDLNGRVVGQRYVDLRSRMTNSGSRGLTYVFHSKPAEHLALAAAPTIDELMQLARLPN